MAEYFDRPIRSSKRRRTSAYNPSDNITEPENKSSSFSASLNSITSLSKRLFSGQKKAQTIAGEDSGYGSIEGSFTDEDGVQEVEDKVMPVMATERHRDDGKSKISHFESTGLATETMEQNDLENKDHEEGGDDDDDIPEVRSSGRQRRRPRRFSNENSPVKKPKLTSTAEPSVQSYHSSPFTSQKSVSSQKPVSSQKHVSSQKPVSGQKPVSSPSPSKQLKGILTPSKRKQGTPKSVVFDESIQSIESRLGFKDIDHSSKQLKQNVTHVETPPHLEKEDHLVQVKRPFVIQQTPEKAQNEELLHEPEDKFFDVLEFEDLVEPVGPPAPPIHDLSDYVHSETDSSLLSIKSQVLKQMTSNTSVPIVHLPDQYQTLHSLLSATITAGESNSLLLIGSRGTGKSLLVNTALKDLKVKFEYDFHVIRLNGFLQTDDKLALREIWRQLGREMQVSEDETGEVQSYADTMASLLSLLSHPEELADPNFIDDKGEEKAAKSVVFVLDEFDLFTTHPRQTLLYNLFDIAQSRKAPIAVIGCSTRLDVIDCLEKRVKSRFNHRWVHVPNMKTLGNFEDVLRAHLCLADDGIGVFGLSKQELGLRLRWNDFIMTVFLPSPQVQILIKNTFYSTKSIPDLLTALYIPVAMLVLPEEPDINEIVTTTTSGTKLDKTSQLSISSPPSIMDLLPNLPTLHISLLVAACRLDTIHHLAAMNFNIVYSHYTELVTRAKLQRSVSGAIAGGAALKTWNKDAARAAWEELGDWELIVPVTGLGSGINTTAKGDVDVSGEVTGLSRMWRLDVTLEEMSWATKEKLGSTSGTGEILGKWCREI